MSHLNPLKPNLPRKLQERWHWGQLPGSSLSLCIAEAAKLHPFCTLVITQDTLGANYLQQELKFFVKNDPDLEILQFPDWETLSYDNFSPHQDIISERLTTLYRIPRLKHYVLIAPIATLMHQITPQHYLDGQCFIIQRGERFDVERQRQQFEKAGYHSVSQVLEHGEFAIRGSIVDIYPMGSPHPYRLDLFDDEVDSIRIFDPDTQRSTEKIDQIHLLPAREYPLDDNGISLFRQNWRTRFPGNPINCPTYQAVSQGLSHAGIEYYLPFFFTETESLLQYLPPQALILTIGDIHQAAQEFYQEVEQRYEQRCHDISRPILRPNEIISPVNEFFAMLKRFNQIQLQEGAISDKVGFSNADCQLTPELPIVAKAENPLAALEDFIHTHNYKLLFCAESAGRQEILLDLLANIKIKPKILSNWQEFIDSKDKFNIIVAPLNTGVVLEDHKLCLICETQLFGEHVMQHRQRKHRHTDNATIIRSLAELEIGAPVVHIDHGVGRYQGLNTIKTNGVQTEFLTLEYAGNDKLYVPVTSLHLVNRFSTTETDLAPLHKLGTESWSKAKRKAAERARDVAAELLEIYAKRAARSGHSFKIDDVHYRAFAASFPFAETPDQEKAINDTIDDLAANKPMDRLICGDVGFGKTEVAMRAAFVAVQGGKQVAILVPTTLLAQQHYESFIDRFAQWPIQIDVISRFKSKIDVDHIITKLSDGRLDIVIGTHRLLQKNIKFKQIGLLILDEEHRFGVRQKEQLKALRADVDILTLTATPIPRTLNMALSGTRDLSIIATPPAKRLSIKTFVREYDKPLIKEAIQRELLRGGQVYFVHNRVETIERAAHELAELLPEAKIVIGHGQMPEKQLEHVMIDFHHQRFNILVCSTIIETGIDVPTANTIIIDHADRFGLAQLHQLRGRVGRSHHQAYAYLLIPNRKAITKDASKRLDAIESLEDLGIGYTLASHDLEIRGAGELLGDEQSGHMNTIGFSLYMELIERAVKSLQAGESINLENTPGADIEIDLQVTALIPEDYLPDVHTRLQLYKRIANTVSMEELKEIQVEMIDRFGLLPIAAKNIFQQTELKLTAIPLGIKKIQANQKFVKITFSETTSVEPEVIIKLIQSKPFHYQLDGPTTLKCQFDDSTESTRFAILHNLIEKLRSRER